MNISSAMLRRQFLEFFKNHQHKIIPSAPLIPKDDPTLLFVNAGMVQFKNYFTQLETPKYSTVTSSQKCVRAGGKHNDLENVGHTARHHTFFEMLGNFSFGDYFKHEAIKLAWDFLTKELKLDPDKLSVSIFAGDKDLPPDDEAYKIWHNIIGLPKNKILKKSRKDNFWQMGDSGPCGPCSEIHYDRSDIQVGFGSQDHDEQIVEIWNLVFMQYNLDSSGKLTPLPAPCVDTGMGLERLATIINNLPSNYDTDLLAPIINFTANLAKINYSGSNKSQDTALRVIADHSRATAFLISDGLLPSNESRGYVLRRIMRRAIRHGAHLGLDKIFFDSVCLQVAELMGEIYPELTQAKSLIQKVVKLEEEVFRTTLNRGLILFEQQIKNLTPDSKLSGKTVFKLYETYGFPPDLTQDLAREKKLKIDWNEFNQAKKEHEEKSSGNLGLKTTQEIFINLNNQIEPTKFVSQEILESCKILKIIKNNQETKNLTQDQSGQIILDQTNFYGESGGQVGDIGILKNQQINIQVCDTQKINNIIIHEIKLLSGEIKVGDMLTGSINYSRRLDIMRNHSATHLLHSALRNILGTHVTQKGSLVAPDKLRFDFSHFEALTNSQKIQIENLVNAWVLENQPAKTHIMSLEEAKKFGALALFGEKYQEKVRVLEMGSHSTELCGGTHCARTGDIGTFIITSDSPLAQGIRRIEAVTGTVALDYIRKAQNNLKSISKILKTPPEQISVRLQNLLEQLKNTQKQIKSQQDSSLKIHAQKAAKQAQDINSLSYVGQLVDFIDDVGDLRSYADLIRDHISQGVIALGHKTNSNKCTLLVATTKNISKNIHAGNLVKSVAELIGGKGGGRPDFAQAGGSNPNGLEKALEAIGVNLKLVQ